MRINFKDIIIGKRLPLKIDSGVYQIKCLITDKVYIGSSKVLNARLKDHIRKLRKGTHAATYLQNSYNFYRDKDFEIFILEYSQGTRKFVYEREQVHLDITKAYDNQYGFNTQPIADVLRADSMPLETRLKIGLKSKQRKMTEESKNKIRVSRLGTIKSEESKYKTSINCPHKKTVQQISKTGEVIAEFHSMMEAARKLGVCRTTIVRARDGKQIKGLILKIR